MEKNVPKLRFPEFNGEWEEKKLGEVADVRDGTHDSPKYHESGYPFVTSKNLSTDGKLDLENVSYINEEDYNKFNSRSKVSINDILFGMIGTIGNPVLVKNEGFAIKNVALIKQKEKLFNSFLIHYLKGSRISQQFFEQNTGGTQKFLSLSIIRNLNVFIPTLPEQTKIANFLTAVDTKISQLKKKKELLEQYKKGVMQQIFSQQLRFKDDNGEDFEDWEDAVGGDIFDSISNKDHNSDLPILAISQEFGAVPREMINYQISVTDKSIESYKVVEIGDFIISLRSFQGGIEYSKYKGICSPAYIILRAKVDINNKFYKYYFKTDFYIQQLCSKLEGIRDGKMISYKYFSEIELPYPSLAEQTKIANFLSAIDEKISHCGVQIEKMEGWKKGLLQQMFV